MPKADWHTLREHIRANKGNVSFGDAAKLLEAAGWSMKPPGKGSHRTFSKPGCLPLVTLQAAKGPLKIGYITNMLKSIDECASDDE